MQYEYKQVTPQYGINYDAGYIGFTYYDSSIVSKGITYFTRWHRFQDIRVSHALVVLDERTCIEALADKNCVEISPLTNYFNDINCSIFFRKPLPWSKELGERIAAVAKTQRGCKYDFGLIGANAIDGTFLGHLLFDIFKGNKDALAKACGAKDKWICSELAAFALDEQKEFHDRGVLAKPNDVITPQELFEDSVIFEEWKNRDDTPGIAAIQPLAAQ